MVHRVLTGYLEVSYLAVTREYFVSTGYLGVVSLWYLKVQSGVEVLEVPRVT